MGHGSPTPSDLRMLAIRAELIASAIDSTQAVLRIAGDRPTRHVAWRLADGAGWLRQAADALRATAADLAFIRDVRGRPHCGADWGCCPDHGATLTCSGGGCRCTAPGCGRSWAWDRNGLPCDQEPAFRVLDADGWKGVLCAGHAIAARRQLHNARLLPLDQAMQTER